ncbi:mannose-1-phosphate guanylyltransferase [Opitutales bacterium ASA1]|uniref:mannose-1-phosphate guanylyltransferase n=1 Tax=Congregicoccus parvus TaxID=3081749 RepID=UPI002B2C9817|nr:mannose-1-phosphate guanylyltransferase [Opitutales bacterium ASA1]
MAQRFVVVMAGGKGERFWPQSRLTRPKQLLPIVGESSMLTQTVERLPGLVPYENILVITNREQRDAVLECCPMLPPENVVAEPVGRDTAAAVGLAALLVGRRDPGATLAMLPADHVIHDIEGFCAVLRAAFETAEAQPRLVTLGITPTEPATGYGYIQKGTALEPVQGREVWAVRRFVEKPDLEKAKSYVASGEFLWNAGMFVWTVASIRSAIAAYVPELESGLAAIERDLASGRGADETLAQHFPGLKKISIDFAVMEKADNVVTLAATFDWDDVGAWPAIVKHLASDAEGNVVRGAGLVHAGANNLVVSTKEHLVAVIGTDDLIVVHTEDATLVVPKARAQEIKDVVKKLGDDERWKKLL